MGIRKKMMIGAGVTAALCIATIGGIRAYSRRFFLSGTTVCGVDVSGMTEEEAKEAVEQAYTEKYSVAVSGRNQALGIIMGDAIDFQVCAYMDGLLDENAKLANWMSAKNRQFDALLVPDFDIEKLRNAVRALPMFNQDVIQQPENAYIAYKDGSYQIVPETEGAEPVYDQIFSEVMDALLSRSDALLLSSACYETPEITREDASLNQLMNELNTVASSVITYEFGNITRTLDISTFHEWLDYSSGEILIDEEAVADWVYALAADTNTAYTTRTFKIGRNEVTVSGPYGYRINRDAEEIRLKEELLSGVIVSREPEYSQASASRENELGDVFVEVDLSNQHVRLYVDGLVAAESDCVTGKLSNGSGTPDGIYPLTYKQKDAVLRGHGYASPVKYWMPFNGNIGLHDASWRSSFGGSIYKTNGSHGCVNLPTDMAKAIYEQAYAGMAVICHY
ncbi:MAG: L,D-transpeptidase family protein [Clostridiales bacterium]|nr:L,D-transpeptidase family protein [Clostridiales bacterium]